MQTYPMITDGGPHPPDKWAAMTAMRIIEDIAPNVVMVDDVTHDVAKSSHPKVAEFRKALGKYEAWLRDEVEGTHSIIQKSHRERSDALLNALNADFIEIQAEHLVDGAKQFHVGLHAHLSAGSAMAAMVERLRGDFSTIIDIERQWRDAGYVVDENHRAVKPGPA